MKGIIESRYTQLVTNSLADHIYVKIFCSYSHCEKDQEFRKRFDIEMKGYAFDDKTFEVWSDIELTAGEEWEPQIYQQLNSADIIVFLVSSDFLASRYCREKELPAALERRARDGVELVPIIIRECAWSRTDLCKYQALPLGAKPVSKWLGDEDSAWKNVGEELNDLAKKLIAKKIEILDKTKDAFGSNLVEQQPFVNFPSNTTGIPDKEWAQYLSDFEQAKSIYESIKRDTKDNQMDRWAIRQDMKSKLFATIEDVPGNRDKMADKSFSNMDDYIRG